MIKFILACFSFVFLLVACGGGGYEDDSWLYHPYYLERTEYLLNYEGECTAIFLGDSRVEGGNWESYDEGWCNFGIGGDTANGILHRLDAIVGKYQVDVIIQVGYNDLARDVFPSSIKSQLAYIKSLLERNGSTVFITSTILSVNYEMNQKINGLNSIINYQIEVNEGLSPGGVLGYTWDGIHLTEEGYEILYEIIRQGIII